MKQREIFIEAMQRPKGAERGAYLAEVCGDDVQMRQSVEQLLADQQNDDSFFLDHSPPGLDQVGEMPELIDYIGKQIGPYKIREQIGEGGMGVVFVAEQEQPVRRKVALKIIKPGMATKNVVARFEAERQALAMMEHPNIARVFDGGATDSGQPYFVMELVRGVPITEYCDEQQLTTRERLGLFLDVCRAVQHAHLKGIIHRDIKPTNILVAEIDGVAVPKVIDFGVAKATGQRLTEQTVYTNFSQMVGTPLYMSPEQAGMGEVDIDTRTDVYSLGVLLYELLTGETPFDAAKIKQAGFDEMRRIIQKEEPPRPSARVSTLKAEQLSTVTSQRRIDPKKYSQSLSGDLDWIVMRTLEKDRNRRYESASAFAADVQCYLDNEPVEACPPTLRYRWSKWYSRNKAHVWIASSFALLLVTASVVSSLGWQKAERALQHSEELLDTMGQVVNVIQQSSDASQSVGQLERVVEKALKSVRRPGIRYSLYCAAGQRCRFAGRFADADQYYSHAEDIAKTARGAPPHRLLWNYAYRARIRAIFQNYEKAIVFFQKSVVSLDADVPDGFWFDRLWVQHEMAHCLAEVGKAEVSRQLYAEIADEVGLMFANGEIHTPAFPYVVYVTAAIRGEREINFMAVAKPLEELLRNPPSRNIELDLATTYAMLQEQLGNEQTAIEFYEKAVQLRQFNHPPYEEQHPTDWIEWHLAELLEKSGQSGRDIAVKMAQWNKVREAALLPVKETHPAIAFGKIRLAKWLQRHSLPDSASHLKEAKAILEPQAFTPKRVLDEIQSLIKRSAD